MTESTEHVVDRLPLLLTGEATRMEVEQSIWHLRGCPDCRDALVDLLAAHAPLASAARFAPQLVQSGESATVMPELTALFAEAHADQAATDAAVRHRRRAPLWLVAAAAAGIIVGGGGVATLTHTGSSHTDTGHSVALSAYDKGTADASMKVKSSDGNAVMRIDAAKLPKLAATERYEVWLTNAARTAMQPIGWLGADNTASLSVPANLSARFTNVEVSVQTVTAPSYEYSGTSVLRGGY